MARIHLRVSVQLLFRRCQHTEAASQGKVSEKVKPFQDIPGPRGIYNVPYLGTAFHFYPFTSIKVSEIHKWIQKFISEYGDILKFRAGNSWVVIVSNPEYSQRVLSNPEKYPFRPTISILDAYYKRSNLTPGLAVINGKEWADLRKPANDQMLRPMAVTSYIPVVTPVANDFVAKYRSSLKIEDCLKTLVNFTTESIGMLCFNRRLGCLDGTSKLEFVEDLGTFFHGINETGRHLKLYRYFETPLYKKFSKAADNLYIVAKEEMQKSLDEMDQLKREGKLEKHLEQPNLLYALMSHPGMTHPKAQSLILDLFVGGIDSTSNALTFLWHELATNQDKQEKLFQEIDSVIGKGNLSREALANMPYLKSCVKESLRKNYPLSGGGFRLLHEDNIIGGYQIPKGTAVIISMRSMSKDAKLYKDPHRFIPERFIRGDNSVDVETRHTVPFAYLPFGFGPRSCIGQRFAESEIYIITTKLIQAYHISLTPEVPKELEYTYRIFACPTTKVNLQLRER